MHRVVFLTILVALPGTVLAQAAGKTESTWAARHDKLASGHSLYVAGNVEGALAVYQEVKDSQPANAAAYYFLGCAQAALNQYDNALLTLNAGSSVAGDQNKSLNAKILFMMAVIRELKGDLSGAQEAWNTYVRYAKNNSKAVAYISTAMARLKAISQKVKLDDQYNIVRQRIAANK